jgi:rRNA maturation endonuclease Nob1
MNTVDRCAVIPPDGVTQRTRCEKCKRFARLWPGEGLCDRCGGMLPLEYVPRPGRGERR